MFKKMIIHLRYPYAVGIVAVIWFGSIIMMTIDNSLLNFVTLGMNILLSIYILVLGFVKKV